MVCPTGALTEKNHSRMVFECFEQSEKTVVVQYAPSISVSIAEEFGMEPGKDINGMLNAALTQNGFRYSF